MNERRFTISNRSELKSSYATVPLAYHLTRILSGSRVVHQVFEKSHDEAPKMGWIIFKGNDGEGFGVQREDLMRGSSAVQQTLEYVRGAQAVVSSFGGLGGFPLELSLEGSPPPEWRCMRVDALVGELWLATSNPVPALQIRAESRTVNPAIRFRIIGVMANTEALSPGLVVRCERMRVSFPEVGVYGRVVCNQGGDMTVEVDSDGEVCEQDIPGVRLDLGEIEVSLSDLVCLRPGVILNLGEVSLERCYLRLGATVLAEGRFSSKGGELLLTIDSVI